MSDGASIDFSNMFEGATKFTRKITSWSIDSNDILTNMLTNSGLVNDNLYGFTNGTPSYTQFNQPICFHKGTKILCYIDNKEVQVPVEKLYKGVLVKTYQHGYRPIDIIKNNTFTLGKENDEGMYKMKKTESMLADLEMTGLHSILVDESDPRYADQIKRFEVTNEKFKRPWGWHIDGKFRLTSNSCEQFEKMPVIDYTIYSFALDNEQMQYGIWANGVLVESTSHRYLKML